MLNVADFSATTRRRERAESDSQPESIGVPEYSVRVTSVARNGESLERGRLHDGMEGDDDHRCSLLGISTLVKSSMCDDFPAGMLCQKMILTIMDATHQVELNHMGNC